MLVVRLFRYHSLNMKLYWSKLKNKIFVNLSQKGGRSSINMYNITCVFVFVSVFVKIAHKHEYFQVNFTFSSFQIHSRYPSNYSLKHIDTVKQRFPTHLLYFDIISEFICRLGYRQTHRPITSPVQQHVSKSPFSPIL